MSIDRINPSHMKIQHTHSGLVFYPCETAFQEQRFCTNHSSTFCNYAEKLSLAHTTWQGTCPWHKSQKSVVSLCTQTPTTHSGPTLEVQQVLAQVDCKCPAEAPQPNMLPVDFGRASKAEGLKKRAKMAMESRNQVTALCLKDKS